MISNIYYLIAGFLLLNETYIFILKKNPQLLVVFTISIALNKCLIEWYKYNVIKKISKLLIIDHVREYILFIVLFTVAELQNILMHS